MAHTRDESWFNAIYVAHHHAVVRYGLRRMGEIDRAVDLAQDVFAVAWRRRADVPDRVLPWLYGVGRNVLSSTARRDRYRGLEVSLETLAEDHHQTDVGHAETVTQLVDLHTAIASLPEMDQELIRLIGWEQLTVSEAAVALDCRAATVAVRLHRARKRLKHALQNQAAGLGHRPCRASLRGC